VFLLSLCSEYVPHPMVFGQICTPTAENIVDPSLMF
jgi:hypothetical protein